MLEHTANLLRALCEWRRLLKTGGGLVLVVPHRDGTFDHRREVTPMQHLVKDPEMGMGEADPTHLPADLDLQDEPRDPGVHDMTVHQRAARNTGRRSRDHHVL